MIEDIDLIELGYARALWIPSPERYWLRPDGHTVCTEEEAVAEVRRALGEDEHE